MATPIEAATARIACAICSQTDFVKVTNLDRLNCTFTIAPVEALIDPHVFADWQLNDFQMAAVQEQIAVCSPEPSVQTAARNLPTIPANTKIMEVINLLEAIIANAADFTGACKIGR